MLRNIFALRDVKISEYMNLIILKNKEEAERYYGMVVTDTRGPCSKHPRDYGIHHLGTIDTDTGIIMPIGAPKDVTPYNMLDAMELEKKGAKNGTPS